jgi:hypothetical protein
MRRVAFVIVAAVLVVGPVVAWRFWWHAIEPPGVGCAVSLLVCSDIEMSETSWMPADVRPVEVEVARSSVEGTWRVTVHPYLGDPIEGTCTYVSDRVVGCRFPDKGS